ncbi:MAG TPA: class A beta-lactamase [Caulobacteraceae bacterium]|nr:class A beta-lactamase [Caulobacteraceae bacterium]
MSTTASRRTLIAGVAASVCSGLAAAREPLAEIEARVGGRLGVAALHVASGRRLAHRGDERFAMCSTFKAMAVAALLQRVDAGREQLDRFVRYGAADLLSYAPASKAHMAEGGMKLADLCAAAIELSDNTAANLILGAIGGPPGWTRFVRSLGDARSRLDRTEPTLNTAIPGDPRDTATPWAMVGDLRAVLLGDALSPASRALITGWMANCKTGQARLRAGLPAGWKVADKTGTGARGTANDIAVAWSPSGPMVIACYLTGATAAPDDARDAAIASVGRIVAEALARG